MMRCRSARLLKMQSTPGSGFCFIHRLVFTSHRLWAAGSVSECHHWSHALSDILSKEAWMEPLSLPSILKLEAKCRGA